MPEISSPAARAIDKIVRTSSLIRLHIAEVAQAVRQLLSSPVDIVDTIYVVEGYSFLVARTMDKDEISQHVSVIIEAFEHIDVRSCDSVMALRILKVVFAVGKTLYTTSPGKLESKDWIEGHGREMAERVRGIVATFSRRFSEDFEVMEVTLPVMLLRVGYHEYYPIFSFQWWRLPGLFARRCYGISYIAHEWTKSNGFKLFHPPIISGDITDETLFKFNST